MHKEKKKANSTLLKITVSKHDTSRRQYIAHCFNQPSGLSSLDFSPSCVEGRSYVRRQAGRQAGSKEGMK